MSPRVVFLAVLLTSVLVAGPSTRAGDDEPSRADVEAALETLFDARGAPMSGQERLCSWGDAAMPHLEAIAESEAGLRNAPALVDALRVIGTERAAKLEVRILEGQTAVPGGLAALFLQRHRRDDPFLKILLANPRFKPAALRWLDERLGLIPEMSEEVKSAILLLCAEVGWMDQVPRIRALLESPSATVRTAAAKALLALTGEEVDLPEPAYSFPAKALAADLVGKPVMIPRQARRDPTFLAAMPWFDGRPHVVYAFDSGVPSFGHRAELRIASGMAPEYERWPLPQEVEALALLPTPEGGQQLVALDSEEGVEKSADSWETVVAWSPEGELRWQWHCASRFLRGLAVLYGKEGPRGVVVAPGGEEGLVVLDLEGRTLCALPKEYVVYDLRAHPALPDMVLKIGTEDRILHYADHALESGPGFSEADLFIQHGVLFPDADGRPAVVLAGSASRGETPTVCRVSADAEVVWKVQVPVEITGLEMLEPAGAPRLLVVTTDQGELLVLDDGGVLRWQGELPFARADGGVETILLAAGEIAPGEYGILVKQVQSCYVIPFRLDALRAPRGG